MARVPLIDISNIPGALGDTLRSRPPLNIYRALANAPRVAGAFLGLGRAVLTQAALDPALRELAILRVGALSSAPYEVHQHRKVARSVGLPDDKINAVVDTRAVHAIFTPTERAVIVFTDAVVSEVKASNAVYQDVEQFLGLEQLIELLITIGYYMLVSRFLENAEVELEQTDVTQLELPPA